MKGAVLGRDEPCKLACPRSLANELDCWFSQTLRPSVHVRRCCDRTRGPVTDLAWRRHATIASLLVHTFFFLFNVVSAVYQTVDPLALTILPRSCSSSSYAIFFLYDNQSHPNVEVASQIL